MSAASSNPATAERVKKLRLKLSEQCGQIKTASSAITARYDAAQTTAENARHWANADHLSARAAHSPHVRRILRIRSRYEVANSPLAKSIIHKLANFVVGTGPRLQVKTSDRAYNRAIERRFNKWMIATGFSRKLWQMRYNKALNGESLGIFFTNLGMRHPVKLDMRTIEADQLADPTATTELRDGSDGIVFDDYGNPMGYRILKSHPGDTFATNHFPSDFETFRADDVVHYFDAERPGQVRGIPELTPALHMFAMRRRYMLAVLAAAETAASIAALIHTKGTVEDPDEVEPLDLIDLEMRMAMTLPKGWEATQIKAEQPTNTIQMFDGVLLREIARCFSMPYGIAASDSSDYNFASAKIDNVPWWQVVKIEQDHLEDVVTDRAFQKWFAEASRISGYLPQRPSGDDADDYAVSLGEEEPPPHQWFWDGQDLLDPREAGSKATGLGNGFETHNRIFARRGEDVLDEWEAQAELLGISLDQYREKVMAVMFARGAQLLDDDSAEPAGGPTEDDDDS